MPKDPVMLLSFVNTQLRDNYNTLEELCKSYMISEEEITNKLKSINYEYNTEKNQFNLIIDSLFMIPIGSRIIT